MFSRDVMLAIRDGDQFPPKRLLLRSMNLRVVRLAIEVEDMIPLNRLYDIANNVRDVKLYSESKKMLTHLHFLANHENYWKTNQKFVAL